MANWATVGIAFGIAIVSFAAGFFGVWFGFYLLSGKDLGQEAGRKIRQVLRQDSPKPGVYRVSEKDEYEQEQKAGGELLG